MKKILITALAALFMFSGCNQEGEEPLEEGVMTPEEFFAEIEIDDPMELIDGWWHFNTDILFEKDEHGNYKEVTFYGMPMYDYYFHLSNGLVTEAQRFYYIGKGGWEDVAIADPNGIKIDKPERKFSFNIIGTQYYQDDQTISNEDIVQCKSNIVTTIDLGSESINENGEILYWGNRLKHIGDELPDKFAPYPDNE